MASKSLFDPDKTPAEQVEQVEKALEHVLTSLEDGDKTLDPETMFDDLKNLTTKTLYYHPELRADFLDTLQAYSSDIIKAFLGHNQKICFEKAATTYICWHKFYETEDHPQDKRKEMVMEHVEDLLDQSDRYNDTTLYQYAIIDETVRSQAQTLHYNANIIEESEKYVKKKPSDESRKIEHAKLLEENANDKQNIADFIMYHGVAIIRDLPNYTDKDIDDGELDAENKQQYYYSFCSGAVILYENALEAMKLAGPQDALYDFIEKVQPNLSVTILQNLARYKKQSTENESVVDTDGYCGADQALQAMDASIDALVMAGPPGKLNQFLAHAYDEVANKCIQQNEIPTMTALHDKVHENLPLDQRASFMSMYASRTIYDMIHVKRFDQAGAFLEHVRKQSNVSEKNILVLLNSDKQKIVGASGPLGDKSNARGMFVFSEEATQQVNHVSVQENAKANSFSYKAKTQGVEIRKKISDEAEELSLQILSRGLDVPHNDMGARWRIIDRNAL